MGYCMSLNDSDFRMVASNKPRAYQALERLDQTGVKSGGSFSGGRRTGSWFAWMDPHYLSKCATLEEALDAWRYPVDSDDQGNIISIDFDGEKIGDEDQLFAAIAPFVEPGSYIEMHGEDGAMWRWVFDGQKVKTVDAKVVWDDGPGAPAEAPRKPDEDRFGRELA